jgi:hypothetical protein
MLAWFTKHGHLGRDGPSLVPFLGMVVALGRSALDTSLAQSILDLFQETPLGGVLCREAPEEELNFDAEPE